MVLRILFLLIPFATLAQEERYFENRTESFEELEIELISNWENQPDSLSTNFELGALYWEHAKYDMITPEMISSGQVSQETLDSVVMYYGKAKNHLDIAKTLAPYNLYLESALLDINFTLGVKEFNKETHSQAFKVIEGDTINKIDEFGMLQGEWEKIYPDGSFRCRGRFVDGQKDGYWERKYENGNWQYQVNFVNGALDGYCKWFYPNGNVKTEGNFIRGEKDSIHKYYFENGNLISEEFYINGKPNGTCKYFNEDGILIREGNLINDERNGPWIFYDESGKKTTLIHYEKGVAIKTESFE